MLICFGSSVSYLKSMWGCSAGAFIEATFRRFHDGEISFQIHTPVMDQDILLIHSTCPPVHDHLFEFLMMVDALRQKGARTITAFMPYMGYGRQDQSQLIPRLMNPSGIDQLITLDIHSPDIRNFFSIPTQNISMSTLFIPDIRARFSTRNSVIVSPDRGGMERARMYASDLDVPLAVLHKKRTPEGHVRMESLEGNVRDKTCLIMDDMIDSGETVLNGVEFLHANGAREVHAYITHAVFSHGMSVLDRIPHLSSLTLSNSISFSHHPKVRSLSLLPLVKGITERSWILNPS